MKTGRHITREISTINRIEESDIKDYYGKLPTGIGPLVLSIIGFVLMVLIGMFVPNGKIKWTDVFVIASYITFSLGTQCLVGRLAFFQVAGSNLVSVPGTTSVSSSWFKTSYLVLLDKFKSTLYSGLKLTFGKKFFQL